MTALPFLRLIRTRYSAAKPQRLLLTGIWRQARKAFPRRSRAETREAGTLPFRTARNKRTGPPFSHQPEDRVNEQARLYGFLSERQANPARNCEKRAPLAENMKRARSLAPRIIGDP